MALKFKAALGADALDDPRFATAAARERHAPALIALLDAVFASRDQAEWRRILDTAGLVSGIVADLDEIHKDEQILASGALVAFSDGSGLTVASPIWISGQDKVAPRPAPDLGQHSTAILREAGWSEAEIDSLRTAGVIA